MFESLESILRDCEKNQNSFPETIINYEMRSTDLSRDEVISKMKIMWNAMLSASENYDGTLVSKSGLTGGDGKRFEEYSSRSAPICGTFISKVITEALKMAENNACMKRIVASPTAGSCGVLPAVLIPLYREKKFSDEKIINALFVAAGIGQVIANRASISGAEGGCQAEIGSASAMASGALVYLSGGTKEDICNAVGFSLKNLLGLVCDPVAGLVEIPCVKRNVIGAVNACSCADMVLAGIKSKIPADEIIDAMKSVGIKMDTSLKETGFGEIANTPTAKNIQINFGA